MTKNVSTSEITNKKLTALKLEFVRKYKRNITFKDMVARLVEKATLKDVE